METVSLFFFLQSSVRFGLNLVFSKCSQIFLNSPRLRYFVPYFLKISVGDRVSAFTTSVYIIFSQAIWGEVTESTANIQKHFFLHESRKIVGGGGGGAFFSIVFAYIE